MTRPERSLRSSLGRLFALVAALGFVGVVASTVSFAALLDARHETTRRIDPARLSASALLAAYVDQQSALRGYLAGRDPQLLEPYDAADDRAAQLEADIAAKVTDATTARDLAAVRAAIARWRRDVAEPLRAEAAAGRPIPQDQLAATGAVFDDVRVAHTRLADHLTTIRVQGQHRIDRATIGVVTSGLSTFAVMVAGGVVVWIGLRRRVLDPLGDLASQARRVAGGDLDLGLGLADAGELGDVARAVEAMRVQLTDELRRTERQRVELEEASAALARSNVELEQFAYVASHDLQEPLRKVASFCELLQRRYGGQLDERADQYIAFAVDGAHRMQQLVSDLLSFSRVGRTTERFAPLHLADVVTQALSTLDERLAEAGATVEVGPLPDVVGDAVLLHALFQNLLSNAVKFRDPARPLRVEISAVDRPGGYRIAVADNGIGIEPRFAERVFVIFQRLHPRETYDGTGIGLALCRKIVEFHGGTIGVDTERAEGTRFVIDLPEPAALDRLRSSDEADGAAGAAPTPVPSRSGESSDHPWVDQPGAP